MNLLRNPLNFASPPMVLERIKFGLNLLISSGKTSAPLTNWPTIGNPKFFVGVITASSFRDFAFLSKYPCGSI